MEVIRQAPGGVFGADAAIEGGHEEMQATAGVAQGPVAFKTSFKTAIVNRKSAMLLLSQVLRTSTPVVPVLYYYLVSFVS